MPLRVRTRSQEADKHGGSQPNFSPGAGGFMGAVWVISLAVAEWAILRARPVQPTRHRSGRLALRSCADMHSLSLRTEQAEQLDRLRAGAVEPVR